MGFLVKFGRCKQGGICRRDGEDMSWSLDFEVLHEMAYFVLMCCGHMHDRVPLTDFTYKYHPVCKSNDTSVREVKILVSWGSSPPLGGGA